MRRIACTLALFASLLAPRTSFAHGAEIPVAPLDVLTGVGNFADESYAISWTDGDPPADLGEHNGRALSDTPLIPPTFPPGTISPELTGTPIAMNVPAADPANMLVWNTSTVATGNCWIWSRVDDPSPDHEGLTIVSFSPGLVSVRHGVEEPGPAVVLTSPDNPYDIADAEYVLNYYAFDPDGTARVKLEAIPWPFGQDPVTIAENLPASSGTYTWATSTIPEGEWMLRATIADGGGRTFVAHARFILLIARLGARDGGVGDTGTMVSEGGCSCSVERRSLDAGACWGLLALLVAGIFKRRAR